MKGCQLRSPANDSESAARQIRQCNYGFWQGPANRVASRHGRSCAVAIPVKDEAELLPRCLSALSAQRDDFGSPLRPRSFCVVIFANNCTDNSAAVARALADRLLLDVDVVEASLPPAAAHAGAARRSAMDIAEGRLVESGRGDGIILTTDADSQVPLNWIANNRAAIDLGVDAVLGRVALDEQGALLPKALHRRGSLEAIYEALITELSALLDPLDYNPWPHHATISGASLAVTVEAYRRVGRLPCVPLGEDKALVTQLLHHDSRIRFAPEIEVVTSGRINGRAPGGVADTLRLRSEDPDAVCDETLEPFNTAIKRARWRGCLRHLHKRGELHETGLWCAVLGLHRNNARRVARATTFGRAWSIAEAGSPFLRRRLLTPADLPGQIHGAQRVFAWLRRSALSARQNVEPEEIVAILPHNTGGRTDQSDEDFRSLVPA